MSDTKPAAEDGITNPTDISSTEAPAKVAETPEQTGTHGATGVAEAQLVGDNEKPQEKTDEPVEAVKSAESSKAANGDSQRYGGRERNGDRRERGHDRNNKRFNNRDSGPRQKRAPRESEFDNLPESDDPVDIRDQVEFYFSNQNLTSDEHMFIEMNGPENRPISLKHISTFKRMRRFTPYSAIVAALRESDALDLVEDGKFSGAGNEGVKRKVPITIPEKDGDEERKPSIEQLFGRFRHTASNSLQASIYAKDFGDEVGQIAIENFFKPYGAVVVRKRRDDQAKWKGSVFVEFDSEESQKSFLALDPKPKFNDKELVIMGKKEYNDMKCKEKGIDPNAQNNNNNNNRDSHRGRGGGRGRGRGGRGGGRGRGNDRSGRFDNRRDRNRSRSRSGSPHERRRRDRSHSNDSRDWNGRRDKFQKGGYKDRDDRRGKRSHDSPPKKVDMARDERGVPIVRDTRGEPEPAKSNKRKADDGDQKGSPKKSKVEIKEDA
ncbi:hypothetical protein B0J11DRAFT_273032 [Dendryphion nanum]|uniref:La protein n=1 Tax=Dendryphion nanum TaxID=256645 RepID=A0A9P9DZC1_9PLEO|nr:hypothetical protein B0J11DRAFT_273032 [Dendryphion nanum]